MRDTMKSGFRDCSVRDERRRVGIRRPVWGALCALAVMAAGCHTNKTFCRLKIEEAGKPTLEYTGLARDTVIGGGDRASSVEGNLCGDLKANTKDTGFSDNFVTATEIVADALRKSTPAGAASGVIERGIDALNDDEPPIP